LGAQPSIEERYTAATARSRRESFVRAEHRRGGH
jgi:hypothetical protein